jgi:hypothetical protein
MQFLTLSFDCVCSYYGHTDNFALIFLPRNTAKLHCITKNDSLGGGPATEVLEVKMLKEFNLKNAHLCWKRTSRFSTMSLIRSLHVVSPAYFSNLHCSTIILLKS